VLVRQRQHHRACNVAWPMSLSSTTDSAMLLHTVPVSPSRRRLGVQEDLLLREWAIPPSCFDTENGELMKFVVDCTAQVLAERGDTSSGTPPVIGFCFR
jgi:hypothetical protein